LGGLNIRLGPSSPISIAITRSSLRLRGGDIVLATSDLFPLSIDAGGRFLRDAQGNPFFPIIDTAWCAPQQLTTSQMDTYVADCVTRKINSIIIELVENTFSDNAPNTIDSIAPFTTVNDFSTPNETYFARVDHLISACKAADIVVWMWPVYTGLQPGGSQGWSSQFEGNTQAKRESWGQFVANRYKAFGNVVFVHGGDGIVSSFTPYNDYIDEIVSIWPQALHSYHGARGDSAWEAANGQSWLSLNNSYINGTNPGADALTEYNRSPVRPLFFVEGTYETGANGGGIRNELWASICSGCLAGVAYGNDGIWTFGGPGFDQNFASHYGDDGRASLQHIRTLVDLYSWWLLAPVVDTSLVTTSLGSGVSKICPMLASDVTFAWIYSPSANFTLNRAAFAGAHANIRIRSFTTSSGAFSTISSSVPTTGTQAITVSADQVIVVDGA
jgi:hypothetical protein